MATRLNNIRIPSVTCTPWKPVSVKKADDDTLVVKPMPSVMKTVNS